MEATQTTYCGNRTLASRWMFMVEDKVFTHIICPPSQVALWLPKELSMAKVIQEFQYVTWLQAVRGELK
jgi:hypothetical protein